MQKTVCIFKARLPKVPHWDPDSIHTGVSGSEEAVIYSAESFKNLGFKVFVLNNIKNKEKYAHPSTNPCYAGYLRRDDFFDFTIMHDDLEFINIVRPRTKKLYLFPNNICTKKFQSHEINSLDGVLWTSSFQRDHWVSMNPDFEKFKEIFGYALDPTQFKRVEERKNPYSCIYASDYARGLTILLDLWARIKMKFPKATLDIYYGLRNWGNISLQEEQSLQNRIIALRSLRVIDHGQVGHLELARAFSNASLWTYPCTHHETFCITAIKAQLAGAIPVIIETAALAETVKSGFKCTKAQEYEALLIQVMENIQTISLDQRDKMGKFVLDHFTWEKMIFKWSKLFY